VSGGGVAATTDPRAPDEPVPPLLAVVKGGPTPEQLAALVAVVCSLRPLEGDQAPTPEAEAAPEPALWGGPAVRSTPVAGPGAWRASGLPRTP
jgi:hypothetical protein